MISPPPRPVTNPEPEPEPEPKGGGGRTIGGRSASVVAIIAAGLAVLAGLTLFLLLSGRNDEDTNQQVICLPVTLAEAESMVMSGSIARLHVLTERGKAEIGPLAVTLDLDDLTCRELPKGVQGQDDFYRLIGITTVYNQTRAGEERINVLWEEQSNIPLALLATSTATALPTNTPAPPTATAVPPTATAVPPTATAVPPTATAVPPTAMPPTATPAPPTATPAPPTATPAPPTATATATAMPPTATPAPPTATAVPPTVTPELPSATQKSRGTATPAA